MTEQQESTPNYRVRLTDLERGAHVPVEDQVCEESQPPAESPISPDKLNRIRLLGVVGDGRW
jgi:hypothetical protein